MDLSKLLNPRSVAIVGASREPNKIGAIVLRNILESGFGGEVYPVNPKAEEIGKLKCFPDYKSIPEVPDLAVICIPAAYVITTLEEIGQKGTKGVVVISAGFGETGAEGKLKERELIEIARKNDIALLGPNCLGFVNNTVPINATFGQVVRSSGNLRFISQSGAIASSIFDYFEANGLGFSEFVTLGNKAVIGENEVMQYFLEIPRREVKELFGEGLSSVYPVGMYLESVVFGEGFVKLVTEVAKRDPVFVLKPGKSAAASRAMQSHTGAMAGEDVVLEAALRKCGAIRCFGIEDLFDLSRAFSWEEAPKGPRVAIVSNAGGPAVISADFVSEYGLELAAIDGETKSKLMEVLPREAGFLNPIDVLGDALAQRYQDAMEILLKNDGVDALVVILTPQVMTQIEETAKLVGEIGKKYGKPIVCSFMGGSNIATGENVLDKCRIPSFRYPERAIRALSMMWKWEEWRGNQMATSNKLQGTSSNQINNSIVEKVISEGRVSLSSVEANELMKCGGIKVVEMVTIDDEGQAISEAYKMGFPVVLKMSSEKLLHKTEVGGVWSNIYDETELKRALVGMWNRIGVLDPEIKPSVKLVMQKQVNKGVEVIMGMKRDPSFGPVIMFGAGGTLAELIKDRNLGVLPMEREEIIELIKGSKVYKLLSGFRGESGYEIEGLVELVMGLSRLAISCKEIKEMEINPVIVNREGSFAVDPKVVVGEFQRSEE